MRCSINSKQAFLCPYISKLRVVMIICKSAGFWRLAPVLAVVLISTAAYAAIGVYEHKATLSEDASCVTISYRLNCPGEVTIDILDSSNGVIQTLGPFAEAAGLQSHEWQPDGAATTCKARISATCTQSGEPNKLVNLYTKSRSNSIRGIAVDFYAQSPGYGTIYVASAKDSQLLAYNPDGSNKPWDAPNASGNILTLGMGANMSPWGVSVDRLGNIYVASKSTTSGKSGIKVLDYRGNELYYILTAEPQKIFWLAGVATDNGLEVFESLDGYVRSSPIINPTWSTVVGHATDTIGRQICFEVGGNACYVATSGINPANPGVTRYIRQPDNTWLPDANFDCGLNQIIDTSNRPATRCAYGVSCDSQTPFASGSYNARYLWIGLNSTSGNYGGNVLRLPLDGQSAAPTLLRGVGGRIRIIAADAVGNIVMETDATADIDALWSNWGVYAFPGETNIDIRTTNTFTTGGVIEAQEISRICECRNLPDGAVVQLISAKPVTAVFDGCIYIEEPDRSCAIKAECDCQVTVGSTIKVIGTMATKSGERALVNAQVVL